jgi:hypothetical protein
MKYTKVRVKVLVERELMVPSLDDEKTFINSVKLRCEQHYRALMNNHWKIRDIEYTKNKK